MSVLTADDVLAALTDEDRAFIARTRNDGVEDPGYLTVEQVKALSPDDKLMRKYDLGLWNAAFPLVATRSVRDADLQIAAATPSSPGPAAGLSTVTVITGKPGTGKSMYVQDLAATQMRQLSRIRVLRTARGEAIDLPSFDGIYGTFRPVIYLSLDRRCTPKQLFTALCDAIGWAAGDDPQVAFGKAMAACGTELVIIDEIQFVNFDGETGRYVHDALKWITNSGVRLLLAGHSIKWLLRRQKTEARMAASDQSSARWDPIEFTKLGFGTTDEQDEWLDLLEHLDARVRLAGHDPDEQVLSTHFAEYLWVSTLGYLNHLKTLVTKGLNAAASTRDQRLTENILDRLSVESRAQETRMNRLAVWRAGKFPWDADWHESGLG